MYTMTQKINKISLIVEILGSSIDLSAAMGNKYNGQSQELKHIYCFCETRIVAAVQGGSLKTAPLRRSYLQNAFLNIYELSSQ